MYGEEMLFLGAMGSMAIVAFIIAVVFYVLKSIGITTLAANKGLENSWLGWIPVADLYLLGAIVDEMDLFGVHISNLALWVPVILVGGGLLSSIPAIGWLLMIAVFIFAIAFMYKLFAMYTENAILFTVLSVLLSLAPVFLFVIRNNEPINPSSTAV